MSLEGLGWLGYEVRTVQANWVCTKSRPRAIAYTADGIDYFLEFSARNKQSDDVPDTRTLQLRTTESFAGTEPLFLRLVAEGQMLETEPWDRFMEVYKTD